MESTALIVGVDVSKRWLDIAVEGRPGARRIENRQAGIRAWLKELPDRCLIGVESSGEYQELLVNRAMKAGHTVYVLNARDLSKYAQSLGRRAKTDRLDAQLIARYLDREHEHLRPYRLASKIQRQLDQLIRRRHTIVVMQRALRQSFATVALKLRSSRRAAHALQALIEEIDRELEKLVREDPALSNASARLLSVVGFGPLVSKATAHALTRHDFKHSDAFVAYIGYDPRVRDSGQYRGRRYLSKRGPAEMRRLLFNAAMSASRTKLWQPVYARYRARGFSTTASLVIIARKLARIAFSIVKHDVAFDPERFQRSTCAQP